MRIGKFFKDLFTKHIGLKFLALVMAFVAVVVINAI